MHFLNGRHFQKYQIWLSFPVKTWQYINICDEGKGNSSILHVRGVATLKIAAILKNWQPFEFENVKLNLKMSSLTSLTRKILESAITQMSVMSEKEIPPFYMSGGSHYEKRRPF